LNLFKILKKSEFIIAPPSYKFFIHSQRKQQKQEKKMAFSRVYIYDGVQKEAEQGVGYKVMCPDWKAREGEFQ
jgi:hypothetical protein